MKSVIAAGAIALALTAPAAAQAAWTPPPPGSPICKLNYVLAPTYGVQDPGRFAVAASVHCPSGAWGDFEVGLQVKNASGWPFVPDDQGGANPGLYQFGPELVVPLNNVWYWGVYHACDPTRSYRTYFRNDLTGLVTTSDPVTCPAVGA